jgi:hypothetical protein
MKLILGALVLLSPVLFKVVLKVNELWNGLIAKNNWVDKLLADIDAILKKRYELVPSLVAVVKQYMQHEADTLTAVAELRSQRPAAGSPSTLDLDNQLAQALASVTVKAESYPQLKASQSFLDLQRSLEELEEQLLTTRRAYINAVTRLNDAVEIFPSSVFASVLKVKRRQLIEISVAERQSPMVSPSTVEAQSLDAAAGAPAAGSRVRTGTAQAIAASAASALAMAGQAQDDRWRVRPLSEFPRFLEGNVLPGAGDLDNLRQQMVRNRLIAGAVSLTTALGLVGGAVGLGMAGSPGVAVALVCAAIVTLWIGNHLRARFLSDFRGRFKTELLPRLLRFFGDFTYEPTRSIDLAHLSNSLLFKYELEARCKGEDYVAGMAGKTRFQCSEVDHDTLVKTTNTEGQETTQWELLFKGLFFVADFNKKFDGFTLVLPRGEKPNWGDPVHLEDPEFEKLFSTYADDQTLARYVLSPALMRRIVEFRRSVGQPISLSFRDGLLYAAVKTKRDLFEPQIREAIDASQCVRIFEDMHSILGIVEELNLNTRIWTKH